MSRLRIYDEQHGESALARFDDHAEIARELGKVGIRFERWSETLKALKALYILFFLIKLKTLEAI